MLAHPNAQTFLRPPAADEYAAIDRIFLVGSETRFIFVCNKPHATAGPPAVQTKEVAALIAKSCIHFCLVGNVVLKFIVSTNF
jgi:hypothetical protein